MDEEVAAHYEAFTRNLRPVFVIGGTSTAESIFPPFTIRKISDTEAAIVAWCSWVQVENAILQLPWLGTVSMIQEITWDELKQHIGQTPEERGGWKLELRSSEKRLSEFGPLFSLGISSRGVLIAGGNTKSWRQSLRRILITIVVIYALFCAAVFFFQRGLLYFPTKIPANVIGSVAKEHGFEPWKNSSGQIIGWKIPATSNATGNVLIIHGNAGCALGRDYIAQPIHDMEELVSTPESFQSGSNGPSVDVFVLEYPGYGARPGSPSKASMVAAAEEAFQNLPAGRPKYLVAESIGTGPACELARAHPNEVAGMALFVPYHNLAAVAQKHFPFLPAYFFLRDRFNPAASLKSYHGPVKFVLAGADEILGSATGKKLADGYSGPKDVQIIEGAHHNDVSAQPPSWWKMVLEFWQQEK